MDTIVGYTEENLSSDSIITAETNLLDCYRIALDFGLQAAQQAYKNMSSPAEKEYMNPFWLKNGE